MGKRLTSSVAATAVVLAASITAPGVAWAQTNDYTQPPPSVAPQRTNTGSPVVLGSTQTLRADSDNLPFTGADIAQFTVVGLSALGAGFALRRRSRRVV